ncbi:hypothetical protein LC608_36675 [Nostoc sp. XA010]|uniref:hypothetical protein n=1 Tax=Nostoc sp. XA010 TaxID=2780407 RepID=UPI001E5741A3|nr:hypothetical protein [Nostoc sp. XA010]MCC5662340.1 hypothetical protein [Nostoc sp. XA010]
MKPLWRTSIILTAIAGAIITTILIFKRTKQPSIALTEEWIATQVADGDSITLGQTDGSQMSVELCGIDAPEVKQGEVECPNQIAFENAQRIVIASKTGVWSSRQTKLALKLKPALQLKFVADCLVDRRLFVNCHNTHIHRYSLDTPLLRLDALLIALQCAFLLLLPQTLRMLLYTACWLSIVRLIFQ